MHKIANPPGVPRHAWGFAGKGGFIVGKRLPACPRIPQSGVPTRGMQIGGKGNPSPTRGNDGGSKKAPYGRLPKDIVGRRLGAAVVYRQRDRNGASRAPPPTRWNNGTGTSARKQTGRCGHRPLRDGIGTMWASSPTRGNGGSKKAPYRKAGRCVSIVPQRNYSVSDSGRSMMSEVMGRRIL